MKKLEISLDYLQKLDLPQDVINKIVKDSNPDYWINKLPNDINSPCIYTSVIYPIDEKSITTKKVEVNYSLTNKKTQHCFSTVEDAYFIAEKCALLVEMSNFAYIKNSNWQPNWKDKEQKKYGIILKESFPMVIENDFYNLYVFGIVLKNRALALEMLEEFRDRIIKYLNKPFNSFIEKIEEKEFYEGDTKYLKEVDKTIETNINTSKRKTRTIIKPNQYDRFIHSVVVENKSVKEICEEFNISRNTVESLCVKLNVQIKNKIKKNSFLFDENAKKEFEDLVKSGFTIKELANHYNCCDAKISSLKKQYGLINIQKYTQEQKEEFIKLYKDKNLHRNEIMKIFNIKNISTFYNLKKQLIN